MEQEMNFEKERDEAAKNCYENKECYCSPDSYFYGTGVCPYHDEYYEFKAGADWAKAKCEEEIAELKLQNEIMREALEFYAKESEHPVQKHGDAASAAL